MPRPCGRPLALYETTSPSASEDCICRATTSPSLSLCAPGSVTTGVVASATVHENVFVSLKMPSLAVTEALYGLPAPACAPTVPVIDPVAASIDKSPGNPDAL